MEDTGVPVPQSQNSRDICFWPNLSTDMQQHAFLVPAGASLQPVANEASLPNTTFHLRSPSLNLIVPPRLLGLFPMSSPPKQAKMLKQKDRGLRLTASCYFYPSSSYTRAGRHALLHYMEAKPGFTLSDSDNAYVKRERIFFEPNTPQRYSS
jgi:hypothetical protein